METLQFRNKNLIWVCLIPSVFLCISYACLDSRLTLGQSIIIGFFYLAVIAAIFSILLLPSWHYLRLETEGFTVRWGAHKAIVKWSECSNFRIHHTRFLGLRLRTEVVFDTTAAKTFITREVKTPGLYCAALKGKYVDSPQMLMHLMQIYQEGALKEAPQPKSNIVYIPGLPQPKPLPVAVEMPVPASVAAEVKVPVAMAVNVEVAA